MSVKTVLYADDHQLFVDRVRSRVEQAGYALLIAATGEQALQLCQEENPDLLLLDSKLAGFDGIRVVQLLRDDGYNNPIVVLAQAESEQERDRAIAAGCDDYIGKTTDGGCVDQMLKRHLQDASGIF
ncbi:DNA-binding response OmpR family regulator [Methylohalomonas lacus]|uniref:DNA-binding response OmpR family regulator n=1 Tax=Methylohalomonas lacus TaxID=398773 RepID=A0AAE3HHF2_9GAMM|nr:response regulator [Methylohalomonas lacus]MCS3902314.1 DNA-binding response OmpR family regulator [Methylohalomonas lacus]